MQKDRRGNFIQRWILINADANPPQEWRDSFKLIVSAILALSLWIFLGRIALLHFQVSCEFSRKIADLPSPDSAKIGQIEKAASGYNDTAKTLYALVTPLATAVTGYFFAASGSQSVASVRRAMGKDEDDSDTTPPQQTL